VVAFLIVAYTSFFGVGFIGIVLWFVCAQLELEGDLPTATGSTASLLAPQLKARREMSHEQRAAQRHEGSLAMKSARFLQASRHGPDADRPWRVPLLSSLGYKFASGEPGGRALSVGDRATRPSISNALFYWVAGACGLAPACWARLSILP